MFCVVGVCVYVVLWLATAFDEIYENLTPGIEADFLHYLAPRTHSCSIL